jgi:hypothetical protein
MLLLLLPFFFLLLLLLHSSYFIISIIRDIFNVAVLFLLLLLLFFKKLQKLSLTPEKLICHFEICPLLTLVFCSKIVSEALMFSSLQIFLPVAC